MRSRLLTIIILTMLLIASLFIFCYYAHENFISTDVSVTVETTEKEKTTSSKKDDDKTAASEKEETTTSKKEEKTTSGKKKEETTTKNQEKPSSSKKDEATTSAKKEEKTTNAANKAEETTTKQQTTTSAKKEEVTTSAKTDEEKTTSATKQETTTSSDKNDKKKPSVKMKTFENIQYGEHSNQNFDLSIPINGNEEIGLVMFLHGGGWISGDKSSVKESYEVFAPNKEYATASINYRFINDGENDIDDILNDITLALAKIKLLASESSVNITKVVLSGHSAGGHLSLLYAYKYKELSPIMPVGVFSAPVPDLTLESFYTENLLGDEAYMCNLISKLCGEEFTPETRVEKKVIVDRYSPVNYVSAETVPTVIIHGDGDKIAHFEGSVKLMKKLSQYSVNHELVVFEGSGHGLKGNEDKKEYASELMLACVRDWFGLDK